MTKPQSQDKPILVDHRSLIKKFPRISRHFKLGITERDILLYFLMEIEILKGNVVNLHEVRWDSRKTYLAAIGPAHANHVSVAFNVLEERGVLMSEENGKKTNRFLGDDFLNLVKQLIPLQNTNFMTSTESVLAKETSTESVPVTGTESVPAQVQNPYLCSMIEELDKGTGEFKLDGWEKQPAKTGRNIVGLAKRFEHHFADGFIDFDESNEWFQKAVSVTDHETVIGFVDYALGKLPRKRYPFTTHNRDLLWLEYIGLRESCGQDS